jgi:hypothetical protein
MTPLLHAGHALGGDIGLSVFAGIVLIVAGVGFFLDRRKQEDSPPPRIKRRPQS